MNNADMKISELKILESGAGFYLGKSALIDNMEHPYCRESGYFKTAQAAQAELDSIIND